jgi:imidazoleglycerol-phosphate dehydratase
MSKDAPGVRYAEVEKERGESVVRVVLDLDGEQQASVKTGVGFFDHLLELFAFHGRFDLGISTEGDTPIDDHVTVKDVGVCIGQAIRQAVGEGDRIDRYGSVHAPIDEALALVVVDVSGRPVTVFECEFSVEKLGDLSTEAIEEFFKTVALEAQITIHIHQLAGRNNHHVAESIFMAFGRALRKAVHKLNGKAKGRID